MGVIMDQINLSNQYVGSIDLDVVTAMSIIAQIQLALRHPGNTGKSAAIAASFARVLQELIVAVAPENERIIEMGWNPDLDVNW
jgi:hypothetical protein